MSESREKGEVHEMDPELRKPSGRSEDVNIRPSIKRCEEQGEGESGDTLYISTVCNIGY